MSRWVVEFTSSCECLLSESTPSCCVKCVELSGAQSIRPHFANPAPTFKEVVHSDFEGAVMDAALIGAAQRVEHYEIAAYGTVRQFAKLLEEQEHASLLEETLEASSQ